MFEAPQELGGGSVVASVPPPRSRPNRGRPVKAAGPVGVCPRRRWSDAEPVPEPHEDPVQHRFVAGDRTGRESVTVPASGRCPSGDPTAEGKTYGAAEVHVLSRVVVGWSIADHVRAELVADAVQVARWRRRPRPGTIVHAGCWSAGFDGPSCFGRPQRAGQRAGGDLLVHDAARGPGSPLLVRASGAGLGDVRRGASHEVGRIEAFSCRYPCGLLPVRSLPCRRQVVQGPVQCVDGYATLVLRTTVTSCR